MVIKGRKILVDVERGRTVKGWKPMKLGGGLGGRHYSKPRDSQLSGSNGFSNGTSDRGHGNFHGGRGNDFRGRNGSGFSSHGGHSSNNGGGRFNERPRYESDRFRYEKDRERDRDRFRDRDRERQGGYREREERRAPNNLRNEFGSGNGRRDNRDSRDSRGGQGSSRFGDRGRPDYRDQSPGRRY